MIRAIAFDWGGIFTVGTFDSTAVGNIARLCEASEERVAESYFPLMARFETGEFDLDEFTARFRQESGLVFDDSDFRTTFLDSVQERSGMYRLLSAIPSNYRVAVLSNNVPVLCDRVRNDERMSRVEVFLFSNELGVRKPERPAFDALSEALSLAPQEIVFIDDSSDNIRACREQGFHGIQLREFDQFLDEFVGLLPDVPVEGSSG